MNTYYKRFIIFFLKVLFNFQQKGENFLRDRSSVTITYQCIPKLVAQYIHARRSLNVRVITNFHIQYKDSRIITITVLSPYQLNIPFQVPPIFSRQLYLQFFCTLFRYLLVPWQYLGSTQQVPSSTQAVYIPILNSLFLSFHPAQC